MFYLPNWLLFGALGPLLASLGRSWGALGRSWAALWCSWAALGFCWALLRCSWALLVCSWGALGVPLGCSWGALAEAPWLPGSRAARPQGSQKRSRGRIRRIQAPEAENVHAHAHKQLFLRGGGRGKDFGSQAAPLTLARGYQDLKILDPRHS